MRAKLTIELYWLLGTVVLTGLFGLWIFGDKIFDPKPVDIQLHDTYFVFPKLLLLAVILLLLLTTIYLVRVIHYKLDNRIINGVLTFLLVIALVGQIINLGWVNGLETHLRVLYSREMDKEIQANVLSSFMVTKGTLWTLIIITATILTTTGYKTFKTKRAE
jgi:hypothetical protein